MTGTDWTVADICEADLLEQCLAVVDENEPDLEEIGPQVAAVWDVSEADRIDQMLTVPLDDEEHPT